jgi:hypothetical protein
MRVDKPLWLLVGGVSIVAERVGGAVGRIVRGHESTWNAAFVSARGREVVASLATRGEQVERRFRARASQYLDSRLDRLAGSRPVSVVVDAQLDRLLEPLVDRALPIVLDRLGQQRQQVRAIVWEHGGDLTDELVEGIRDRAVAADTTAERMARRLLGGRRDGSTPDEQTRDSAPPAGRGVRP